MTFFFCSIQAPLDKTLLCDHADMKAIETEVHTCRAVHYVAQSGLRMKL